MKLFSLILCISFLFFSNILADTSDLEYQGNELRGIVDDFINDTLNTLLSNISDPILISDTSKTFSDALITGLVDISNFKLAGLQSIVASLINVQFKLSGPSPINLTLEIGNINLFTNYEIDLVILQQIPIYGKGNVSLNLDKIQIDFYTLADVVLIPTSINGFNNISLEFTIGENTSFSLYGLLNNPDIDDLINNFLTKYTPRIIDFLNTNKDRIGSIISTIVQAIVDSIIKNESLKEYLDNLDISY